MSRIHARLSRLSAIHSVRVGAILLVMMQVAFVGQQALVSVLDPTDTVQAQSVSGPAPSSPTVAESTPATSTEAAPQPTPTPAPAPAVTQAKTETPAVAAPKPAYDKVSIPSIGFSSQFVSVGLTSNHAIDVNPKLVGWWNGSAKPGQDGAVFLDGHVTGIFKTLSGVNIGDDITITMANGDSYNYTIVYRETVALQDVDMKKALTVYGGAAQGVNLMTCAGTYDSNISTNTERLVVYAVRS